MSPLIYTCSPCTFETANAERMASHDRMFHNWREDESEGTTLDPTDPFDAALIPMVETHRRKRADYAKDGTPWDNFVTSSNLMGLEGFGPVEAALFNVTQKLARLKSLRQNGRTADTKNEAVADTYLDLAVYAVIAYAMSQGEAV